MLKKFSAATIVVFYCLVPTLRAQTTKPVKDSTTVIIFNAGTLEKPKSNNDYTNHIVKVEPLGFLSGKIPVIFERRITNLFSIQASLGVTSKNYMRELIGEVLNEPTFNHGNTPAFIDEAEALYLYENRKAKMGYMFSVQPRIHFDDEGLEGLFLGVGMDYFHYNFTVPGLMKSGTEIKFSGDIKKEYENIQDIMVVFGNQKLYDHLSLEYSVGLGLRSIHGVKYSAGATSSGFYEELTTYKSKSGITFGIGFKIGFQL